MAGGRAGDYLAFTAHGRQTRAHAGGFPLGAVDAAEDHHHASASNATGGSTSSRAPATAPTLAVDPSLATVG